MLCKNAGNVLSMLNLKRIISRESPGKAIFGVNGLKFRLEHFVALHRLGKESAQKSRPMRINVITQWRQLGLPLRKSSRSANIYADGSSLIPEGLLRVDQKPSAIEVAITAPKKRSEHADLALLVR